MSVVKINEGTQTSLNFQTIGTTEAQVIRLDIGSGTTASAFGGTISAVSNLVKGTITRVEGGTIGALTSLSGGTVGILTAGTVDTIGLTHASAFATVVSTGTSTLGTVKAAVAGSVIYVTDLVLSAGTTTNVEVASGGTSTPVLGTVHLNTNGGLVSNFRTPLQTASGSALVYKQSVNGPLTITALGYVK